MPHSSPLSSASGMARGDLAVNLVPLRVFYLKRVARQSNNYCLMTGASFEF